MVLLLSLITFSPARQSENETVSRSAQPSGSLAASVDNLITAHHASSSFSNSHPLNNLGLADAWNMRIFDNRASEHVIRHKLAAAKFLRTYHSLFI
jgi:hypothetical protein